jgi:hypothetical protein
MGEIPELIKTRRRKLRTQTTSISVIEAEFNVSIKKMLLGLTQADFS